MYVQSFPLAIHQVETLSSSVDCSSTGIIQSTDSDAHTNSLLLSDTNCYAWNVILCDDIIHATLPILNPGLP